MIASDPVAPSHFLNERIPNKLHPTTRSAKSKALRRHVDAATLEKSARRAGKQRLSGRYREAGAPIDAAVTLLRLCKFTGS
jgi:hypothetical protein